MHLPPGLCPGPRWGAYSTPQTPSWERLGNAPIRPPQDIKHVNECKFLGIYLDTHLTWKRHIEKISSKISSAIFAINRAKDFLSKHALRCLYFALVHSHLTYGINVWGNSVNIKKIITLQKRAIRTINKVWYRSHTEPLFKSNQILKLEDMYI